MPSIDVRSVRMCDDPFGNALDPCDVPVKARTRVGRFAHRTGLRDGNDPTDACSSEVPSLSARNAPSHDGFALSGILTVGQARFR